MNSAGLSHQILSIAAIAIPIIVAITFHEAAHGFVARQLGDETAWRMGRVTFNPIRHIDPFGTVILPLLLWLSSGFVFGYAKPVPVNFRNLHHPRRDMVWVAIAGPGINIALAVASALLLYLIPIFPRAGMPWATEFLIVSLQINVVLAVFNMLPLPPLDGGRVAVGLLPDRLAFPLARLENKGLLILLALLFLLPFIGQQIGMDLHVVSWLLEKPVDFVTSLILAVTGHGA
jgi:Zn-dependent protease